MNWRRIFGRRTPEELEQARRLNVNRVGRITAGEILDSLPAPDELLTPTLIYRYEVRGVGYQVSQSLHMVPTKFDPRSLIPGLPVQVKYDPSNPGNSILACEEWNGLAPPRTKAAGKF